MKVEGWLFTAGTLFFMISGAVYWVLSEEPVGTVALGFTTGLAALIGFYVLVTGRRIDPRPEDLTDAEIADGAGELGFYSPHSWWPLVVAFFAAMGFVGLIIGWWLFIIAAIGASLGVIGLVFEYYRSEAAH